MTWWEHDDAIVAALGDSGPWVRNLATAWQACAIPDVKVDLPPDPTDFPEDQAYDHSWGWLGEKIAFWAPLPHLLLYGLGWTRPDLGLTRWLGAGAPTEDPILRLLDRWWGQRRLAELLAWTTEGQQLLALGRSLSEAGAYNTFNDEPLARTQRDVSTRATDAYDRVWGGGTDSMHLIHHAQSPMWRDAPGAAQASVFVSPSAGPGSKAEPTQTTILTQTYSGWPHLLWDNQLRTTTGGRSVRTSVVCTPVGWLGEFRFSRQTGGWFRGRHSVHLIGN